MSGWRALSLRQPWLWMVLHGKSIENRPRNIGLPPGPFLLHAAKGMTRDEFEEAWKFVEDNFTEQLAWGGDYWRNVAPRFDGYDRGGYCGVARAVGILAPDHGPMSKDDVGCHVRYADNPARPGSSLIHVTERGTLATETREHSFDVRWWMPEKWGYLLADVKELPFVEAPGMLGFFSVPDAVVHRLGLPPSPEQYPRPRRP